MSAQRKCAVFNCDGSESTRHRFPNPHRDMEALRHWLRACGNKKLFSLPPMSVYKSHLVCDKHFDNKYKTRNSRLCKGAVPKLFLPREEVIDSSAVPSTSMMEENIALESIPSAASLSPTTKRSLSPMEICVTPKRQKIIREDVNVECK